MMHLTDWMSINLKENKVIINGVSNYLYANNDSNDDKSPLPVPRMHSFVHFYFLSLFLFLFLVSFACLCFKLCSQFLRLFCLFLL